LISPADILTTMDIKEYSGITKLPNILDKYSAIGDEIYAVSNFND